MADHSSRTGAALTPELPAMPDGGADIEMPAGGASPGKPTDAEVAQGAVQAAREPSQFDDDRFLAHYKAHHAATYAPSGERYEDFDAAYRFGTRSRGEPRYANRAWDAAEADMQRDWEHQSPGTWARVKEAVRQAWEHAGG